MEEIDIAENDSGEGDADVETVDNSVLTFSKHTGNFYFYYPNIARESLV